MFLTFLAIEFQNNETIKARNDSEVYEVLRVIDGDTIEARQVMKDDKKEFIRLLGIDAPELDFADDVRDTKRECYSLESKEILKDLLESKTIILKQDPLNQNRDNYNRLLRYVLSPKDVLINKKMLELGAARSLTYFPIEKKEEFLEAEEVAKKQKVGLWSKCDN